MKSVETIPKITYICMNAIKDVKTHHSRAGRSDISGDEDLLKTKDRERNHCLYQIFLHCLLVRYHYVQSLLVIRFISSGFKGTVFRELRGVETVLKR
jgi:hypothetical protein